MQVEVLRKQGEILFIETSSDFADLLTSIMTTVPIGPLASLTGAGAFSRMADSIASTRDALFVVPKGELVAPQFREPVLSVKESPVRTPPPPPVPTFHGPGLAANEVQLNGGTWTARSVWHQGRGMGWQGGVFKSAGEADGFVFRFKMPTKGTNVMVGVMPQVDATDAILGGGGVHNRSDSWFVNFANGTLFPVTKDALGQFASWSDGCNLAMRFRKSTATLEFACNNGEWIAANNSQHLKAGVTYCPVVLLYQGLAVSGLTYESLPVDGAPTKKARVSYYHPVAKFLFSNSLEMFESSSLKALEIMQVWTTLMPSMQLPIDPCCAQKSKITDTSTLEVLFS